MPLVVEHRYVSEDLEFLQHVASVPVELVDVLDEPCDVVGHGGQFRPRELVVAVHRDAGYHSMVSRCSNRRSLSSSASCSHRSRAAAALS